MTFEEVYQQIRKMHYEILDILTEYRDEWCDDCKRFNTVIRETLNREPSEDGTLEVKVEDATKVGRVLISDDKHRGGLYYPDEDEPQGDLISRAEAAEIFEAMLKTVTDQKIKIGISRLWQQIKDLPSADRPKGGDLISRKEALEALGEEPPVWCDEEYEIAERSQWRADVEVIKSVPSADRPKGEWIFRRECVEDTPFTGYRCSNCNYWQGMGSWNFCPNCGAKMDGERSE